MQSFQLDRYGKLNEFFYLFMTGGNFRIQERLEAIGFQESENAK